MVADELPVHQIVEQSHNQLMVAGCSTIRAHVFFFFNRNINFYKRVKEVCLAATSTFLPMLRFFNNISTLTSLTRWFVTKDLCNHV